MSTTKMAKPAEVPCIAKMQYKNYPDYDAWHSNFMARLKKLAKNNNLKDIPTTIVSNGNTVCLQKGNTPDNLLKAIVKEFQDSEVG